MDKNFKLALERNIINTSNQGGMSVTDDVPNVTDDEEYETHMPMSEAEDDEEQSPPEQEMPVGMPANSGMGRIPASMGGMDMDMGMEDEGPKTSSEVGVRFELKKIFSRMLAIESFLNTASDPKLIKIRNYVSQAIELFKTLISNIDLFKDKIDDILVTFYKFVNHVYDLLQKYYTKQK